MLSVGEWNAGLLSRDRRFSTWRHGGVETRDLHALRHPLVQESFSSHSRGLGNTIGSVPERCLGYNNLRCLLRVVKRLDLDRRVVGSRDGGHGAQMEDDGKVATDKGMRWERVAGLASWRR